MGYKTELHCHTSDISPCASNSAQCLAEKYIAAGYSTVVLTNHATTGIRRRFSDLSWAEFVRRYFGAAEKVKEVAGERLNVLCGMEISFDAEGPNDYLVFGATEKFCLDHPDLFEMDHRSFCALARKNGILFIQAHPMRFGIVTVSPDFVDGYEVFNGHPGQRSHNGVAQLWAEHFTRHELILTSGTDNHYTETQPTAGIITDAPVTTDAELTDVLRSGKYELIRSPLGEMEY